jgi:hypothetical protein
MIRHLHNVLAVAAALLDAGLYPTAVGFGVAVVLAGRGDLLVPLVGAMAVGLAAWCLLRVALNVLAARDDEGVAAR